MEDSFVLPTSFIPLSCSSEAATIMKVVYVLPIYVCIFYYILI